jgi:hypothetical protein
MVTVHYFHKSEEDIVQKLKKRSKKISTNAKVVKAVFGDEIRKLLYIPVAINNYNHHMNGADIAN